MAAFEKALAEGNERVGLEFDVHRTLDKHLVVIHDRTLERTTNGHGRVRKHSLAVLRMLHAGWWWSPGEIDDHRPGAEHPCRAEPLSAGYGIPTLADVLTLWQTHPKRVPLTIEVKSWRAAWSLIDELNAAGVATGTGSADITVTSFADWIVWLARMGARRHDIPRVAFAPGALYMVWFWCRTTLGIPPRRTRYARLQVPIRYGVTFVTPRFVRSAQRVRVCGTTRRLLVDLWTIDDAKIMCQLSDLGVDGIMTDCPATLRNALRRRRTR